MLTQFPWKEKSSFFHVTICTMKSIFSWFFLILSLVFFYPFQSNLANLTFCILMNDSQNWNDTSNVSPQKSLTLFYFHSIYSIFSQAFSLKWFDNWNRSIHVHRYRLVLLGISTDTVQSVFQNWLRMDWHWVNNKSQEIVLSSIYLVEIGTIRYRFSENCSWCIIYIVFP